MAERTIAHEDGGHGGKRGADEGEHVPPRRSRWRWLHGGRGEQRRRDADIGGAVVLLGGAHDLVCWLVAGEEEGQLITPRIVS